MGTPKMETRLRQEQILHAALDTIGELGVRGLSVGEVARRVGLVPSALYRHFPGKDDLIAGLLDRVRANLLRFVAETRAETGDSVECLRRLLLRHLRFVGKHSALPRLIFSDEVASANPEHRERIRGILDGYLSEVQKVIRAGQKAGTIRADLKPAALARLYLGLIQPAVLMWRMSDGAFDLERHAEEGWSLYSTLIARSPRPPLSKSAPACETGRASRSKKTTTRTKKEKRS